MKIKELMTAAPTTFEPGYPLEDAARLLRDDDVGFAPVVLNGMVLGVLTDRDIVVRAVAEGRDVKSTKVRDILTPGAVHCFEDDDVTEAADLMAEHGIRRIVVVKRDHSLAGVLSVDDIGPWATGQTEKPKEEPSMRGAGVSETGDARRS